MDPESLQYKEEEKEYVEMVKKQEKERLREAAT
jgi:hypothetical protein